MSSTQEVGDIFGEGKGIAHAMLRSPTVLIVSIGLWGMNIFFFKLFKIDYKYVLMFDIHKLSKEYDEPLLRRHNSSSTEYYTAVSTGEEKKTDNSAGETVDIEEAQKLSEDSSSNKDPSGLVPTNPYPGGLENRRCSGGSSTKTASNQQQQIQPLEIMKSTSSDPLPSSATPDPTTTTVVTTTSNDHHHHHTTIDWYKLVLFSLVLLALLHIISHYWMDHLNRNVLGAVFWFYGIVGIISLIPIPHMRWLSDATYLTLKRIFELIRPRCYVHKCGKTMQRPIPFVDVFVADAMCSLSKVFFDWGYLIHMACHYPNPVPQDIHSIIIPSIFAAIPYLIRARQCLIMYTIGRRKSDPHRKQHMANAIKYSTSIYPLCLSAYQKTFDNPVDAQNLEGLLILLMVINASYSLYWDIVMDWGMMQNPTAAVAHAAGCKPSKSMLLPPSRSSSSSSGGSNINNKTRSAASASASKTTLPPPLPKRSSSNLKKKQKWNIYRSCRHGLLRSKLRFGLRISLLIMVTDSILRFSWLLRFKPTWFPSPDAFILATQFLEVFRRAIWNLLRVEWENIKQKTAKKKLASLESGGTTDNDEEESSDDDDEFDDEYDDDDDDSDGYDEEELLLTSNASNDAEDGSNDPTTTSAAASTDVAFANSNKESGGGGGMIQLPPLFSSAKNSVQKMGGGGGGVVGLSKMDRSRTSPPPSPEKFQKKVHTGIPHRQHLQRQRSTSPHTSSPKQRKKGGSGGGGGMSW